MGLGKPRSEFGKWLDERGIKHTWLAEQTGLSKSAISLLASGQVEEPTLKNAKRIISVLRQFDNELTVEDFWG